MSGYFNTIKQLGFGDYTTHQQAKGRVSRLSSISRQLFKAHYDGYHPRMSRQLATALKRYINTRPKHERRTAEFVGEIRRKISCLHEYNLQIAKVRYKYPRSELFDTVLMQYVELECELLYHTYREVDPEHEKHVTERVLRFLRVIQHDSLQSSEVSLKSTIEACDKALLKLFANVRPDCISENKLVANAIIKLLNRLNLLDEVNKLKGKNVPFQQDTFLRDPLVFTIRQTLTTSDYESDLDQDDDYLAPVIDEFSEEPSKNFNLDDDLFSPSRPRFTQSDNSRSLPRFNFSELSYRAFESSLTNHSEPEGRRNGNSLMDLNFVPYRQGDAVKREPTRFEDSQTNENVVTIEILDDDDDDPVNSPNLLQANEIKLEENEENRSPNFPIPHSEGNEQNFLSSDKSSKNSTSNGFDNLEKKSGKDCAKDGLAILISDSEDEAVDSVIGSDRSKQDFEEIEDYCEAAATCDFDEARVSQGTSENNETVASVYDATTVCEDVNDETAVEAVVADEEFDETLTNQATLSEVETSTPCGELDETLTNETTVVSDCQGIDKETSHEVDPMTTCGELDETLNSETTKIFYETETVTCSTDEVTESRIHETSFREAFMTRQINQEFDNTYETPCEETVPIISEASHEINETFAETTPSDDTAEAVDERAIKVSMDYEKNNETCHGTMEVPALDNELVTICDTNSEDFDETHVGETLEVCVCEVEIQSENICDESRETELDKKGEVEETCEKVAAEEIVGAETVKHCDAVISEVAVGALVTEDTHGETSGTIEFECQTPSTESSQVLEQGLSTVSIDVSECCDTHQQVVVSQPVPTVVLEASDYQSNEQMNVDNVETIGTSTVEADNQTDKEIYVENVETEIVFTAASDQVDVDRHQELEQIETGANSILINDAPENQPDKQVDVDLTPDPSSATVNDALENQPDKQADVDLKLDSTSASVIDASENQPDKQTDVDARPEPTSTSVDYASENQSDKQVDIDLTPNPTLASVNDASENQPDNQVDVDVRPEPTSTSANNASENETDNLVDVLGPEPTLSLNDAPKTQSDTVNVDLEAEPTSTSVNKASETQSDTQVDVDWKPEPISTSANEASENQPDEQVDVDLEPELTPTLKSVNKASENQPGEKVDVDLEPKPTSTSTKEALENLPNKQVDVDIEPEPTSTSVKASENQPDKQVDVDLKPESTSTNVHGVLKNQPEKQLDVDLEPEPTSTSVNKTSKNQPEKQLDNDLEPEPTLTSVNKASRNQPEKLLDVDLEPKPTSASVNEASENQPDNQVDVDLKPEPTSTSVNEALKNQPEKQVDVDLEPLNDTTKCQTEKQVDECCDKHEVEAVIGGPKCQTDKQLAAHDFGGDQTVEENSDGQKTSTNFVIPKRPLIKAESVENVGIESKNSKELSIENENNCQAIDYSVTACYPVQPPSVPKDATHFHQVNPVGPVYPEPLKSENVAGPEPLSLYTLSSTVPEGEYYDYSTQKKVGGDLELLANICADQETLAVKTDSEKEMTSDLESQTKLNLSQLTPRRRKSKVKFDGKKKQSASEEDNKRLTRNKARTDDPKYKPHDFFSIDTLPPRTNNVYAQKRLLDANTTSEDSNDSCGSTLYIDLEESQKHQEKTPKDEDSGQGDDKSGVCISIPENEEVCVDDNFHILQQMEDFVVDNNNREVPSKIPKARKKRPGRSPPKNKDSKATVPKKRGDKSPSKLKNKKDDTVKTNKTKGKKRQNKTDEDDDNMDDIPIEKRIAYQKSKLQEKRKTKPKEDEHLKNGSRSPRGRPKEKKVISHFEESCSLDISLNKDKQELSVNCTSNVTAVQKIPKKRKYDFPAESFAIKTAKIEEISPDLQSEEVNNDSLDIKIPIMETLTIETEPTKLENFSKVIATSVTVGETEVVVQKNVVREETKVIKTTDHSIENILGKVQSTTVENLDDGEKTIKTKAAVKAYEDKSSVVGVRTRLRSKSSDQIQRQSTPCDRSRSSSVDCNSLSFSDSSHNESVSSFDVSVEDKNEDKDTSTNDSGVVVLKGMSEEEIDKSPVLGEKPPPKSTSKSSKTKGRTLENTIKKMKEKIEESEKAKNKIIEEKKPEHKDKERHGHKSSRSRSSSKSRSSGKHHSSDSEKDRRRRSHSKSVDSKVSTPDSHKRSSSKHERNDKSKPDKKKHEESKSKTEHKSTRSKSKRPDNDKKSEDATKEKHLDQSDNATKAKHEHRKDKSSRSHSNTSRSEKRERSSKEKHKDRKENPKHKEKPKEEKKLDSPKQKQQENGKTKHESDVKNASKIPKKRKYDLQDHGGAPQTKIVKTEPEKAGKDIAENKNLSDVPESKIGKSDVKTVEQTKDIDDEKTKEQKAISNLPQLIKSANESEKNAKNVKSDTKTIDKSKVVKVESKSAEENKTVSVVSQAKHAKSIDSAKENKVPKVDKLKEGLDLKSVNESVKTDENKTVGASQVKNVKSDIKTSEKRKEGREKIAVFSGLQDKNVKLDIKTVEKSKETKFSEEIEKKKIADVADPQAKNVKLDIKTGEKSKETKSSEENEKKKTDVAVPQAKSVKLDIKTGGKSKETKSSEEIDKKKTADVADPQTKSVKLDIKTGEKSKETKGTEEIEKKKIADVADPQAKHVKLDIKTGEKSKETKFSEEIEKKKTVDVATPQAKNVKLNIKTGEKSKETKSSEEIEKKKIADVADPQAKNVKLDIKTGEKSKETKFSEEIEKKKIADVADPQTKNVKLDIKTGEKSKDAKSSEEIEKKKTADVAVPQAKNVKSDIKTDETIKEARNCEEIEKEKGVIDGSRDKNVKLEIKTKEKSKESKNEEIDRKKCSAIGVLQDKNVKSDIKSRERVKEIKTVDDTPNKTKEGKNSVSQSKIPKLRSESIERDKTEAKSVKTITEVLVNHHEADVKSGSDGLKKTENKKVGGLLQTKSVKPDAKRAEKRKERMNSDSKTKESKTQAPQSKVAKLGSEVEKIETVSKAVASDAKTKENQEISEVSEHKSPELDVKISEKTIESKPNRGDVFQARTDDSVMAVPQVNTLIQKADILVQKDLPTDLSYETFASGLKMNSKETEKRDLLLRNAIDPISSGSSVYVNTVFSSSRNIDMVLTTPIDSTVKHLLGQEADLTLIPNISSSSATPCTSTTSVTTMVNASREKTCLFAFNEDAEAVNRDTEIFHAPLGLDEISPTKLPLGSNQSLDFISPSASIAEISNSMSLVRTLRTSAINFEVADTSETADHNYTLGDPLLGGNNEDKNILATGLSLSNSPEEFLNDSHLEDLSFSENNLNNFIEENGTLAELDLLLPCKKEKPDFDNIIDDPIPKPEDIESRIKHLNMMTIPQNEQPKTVSVDSTIDNSTSTDPSVGLGIDYAVNKLLFLGGSEVTLQNITDIENINIMETNNDQGKPEDPTPEISKPDSIPPFLAENQKVVVETVEQFPITSVDHIKEDFIEENRKTEKKPKPEPKPSKLAIFLESVKGGANKNENPKVEDEMEKYTVRRHNRTPVFPPKKKSVTQQLQNKTPPEIKKTPPKGEVLTFEAAINSKPQTAEGRIRVKTDLIKTNEGKSDVLSVEYINEHDQNVASEIVLPFSKPSPSTEDKKPPPPSTQDKKPIPPPSTQDKKPLPPPTKHARFDKMGNDYIMENILNASEKDKKRKSSENDGRREEKRSKKTDSDKKLEKPSTDEIFDKLLEEGPTNKVFAQRMNEHGKKEPPKNRGYNTVQEPHRKPETSSGYSHNNKHHQKRPEYFTTGYMEKRNAEKRHISVPVNHSSSKRYRHDGNSYSSRSDPNINRDLKPRDRRLSSEQARGFFANSSKSEPRQDDDDYSWLTKFSGSGLFDTPSDLFMSPGSKREDTSSRK